MQSRTKHMLDVENKKKKTKKKHERCEDNIKENKRPWEEVTNTENRHV